MNRPDDLTSIAMLKDILEETKLLLGEDGAIYAQFFRDCKQVTYAISSSDFMTWFKGEASERINSIPVPGLSNRRSTTSNIRSARGIFLIR
jgi:hypothetical protein